LLDLKTVFEFLDAFSFPLNRAIRFALRNSEKLSLTYAIDARSRVVTERVSLPQSTSLTALLPPPGHPRCTISCPTNVFLHAVSIAAVVSQVLQSARAVLFASKAAARSRIFLWTRSRFNDDCASVPNSFISLDVSSILRSLSRLVSIASCDRVVPSDPEERTADMYRESVSPRAVDSIQAAVVRISPISRRAEWQRKKEPFSLANFGKLLSRHSVCSRWNRSCRIISP